MVPAQEPISLTAIAMLDCRAVVRLRLSAFPSLALRACMFGVAVAGGMLASITAATAEPRVDFGRLIVLKREPGQLGLPVNHLCNQDLKQNGYDNELAVLSPVGPKGELTMLFRPEKSFFVGEIDLHSDADRLLFSMPNGRSWQVHELRLADGEVRQITREQEGVDNFDATYLPDGGIAYCSTASFHAVPCWHGQKRACAIYRADTDGANVRQLCFDQDLDLHPSVLGNGQVVFSRWDYTGPYHMYLRPLMAMNPDGTGQRAIYGSNSYWPNALYFPRAVPGDPNLLVAIAAGYHGPPRMGVPALIDVSRGWHGGEGVIGVLGQKPSAIDKTVIKDEWYANQWPKYLHPFPLSSEQFLVSGQMKKNGPWGIYLLDAIGEVTPILVDEKFDFFEPTAWRKTKRPPVIPDRTDPARDDADIYLHDIYAGPGLKGVPRGTIKKLRIVAYHFGYPGMAGPDKIGCGGPWEAMRIVGTVPVQADGSAGFKAPANTPLSVQALDGEGKAVQLMRSWFTAMPGEVVSCVGCHETPRETPVVRADIAARRPLAPIEPWHGPPRGFDFQREVQPSLDRYCVGCHDGLPREDGTTLLDLRGEAFIKDYEGRPLARLGAQRLHPDLKKAWGGDRIRYTPAYEALVPRVRRVGIEDDVRLLEPGEYHVDTSPLIQMLQAGHHGVRLDDEAWDRLATWIDLNAPCHGTWGDVGPVPERADRRRRELQQLHGGPREDFEAVQRGREPFSVPAVTQSEGHRPKKISDSLDPPPAAKRWPFDAANAQRRQAALGSSEMVVELGEGVRLTLRRIPAGEFLMGSAAGPENERPIAAVAINRPFWMAECEISNRQFRRFDPDHDSRLLNQRKLPRNGPGLTMNGDNQPAVRVSWNQAMAFCQWLSKRSGRRFSLPTEAQWEWACRAGTETPLSYGDTSANFSAHANMADKALSVCPPIAGGLSTNITELLGPIYHDYVGGDILCDPNSDDGCVASAEVGTYQPNAWSLFDMHGNAAEWTATACRPYPYAEDDGRNDTDAEGERVVRGGSFRDLPKQCRSAARRSYPAWQRVHDVGFRVVCPAE